MGPGPARASISESCFDYSDICRYRSSRWRRGPASAVGRARRAIRRVASRRSARAAAQAAAYQPRLSVPYVQLESTNQSHKLPVSALCRARRRAGNSESCESRIRRGGLGLNISIFSLSVPLRRRLIQRSSDSLNISERARWVTVAAAACLNPRDCQ